MSNQTDPRTPFVIGIIALGVILLGGIVWAVTSAPSDAGTLAKTDVNASFRDENDPALGPAGSPNVLRIFGDFQCPACKAAEPGLTHVRQNYADRLKIVWDDFPLNSHPNARPAANAARCAEEQGKFWEMHDALYNAQADWASKPDPTSDFRALAKRVGLNEEAFAACLNDRQYDAKIKADMQEGNSNGVDATPTFFINQRKIVGVLSAADWDRELAAVLGPAADQTPVPAAGTVEAEAVATSTQ